MRSVCTVFLTLAACAAWAQSAAQPAGQPVTTNETALAPEIELPPRYRVEFILFAHSRFDQSEEYFDIVPPESQFIADDEPVSRRFFDEISQQTLRESIEGPISAPPRTDTIDEEAAALGADADAALDGEPGPEDWLDPALVTGPNTRYLGLEELTLLSTLERLERLDAYTPLVHSGWEQNGLPEIDAVPVALEEFSSANPRGTIRLHMSRYLHIAVDLAYRDEPQTLEFEAQPIPQFGAQTPPLQTRPTPRPSFGFAGPAELVEPQRPEYFLLEERRILRGELNYFDHPAFGLLLQITLAPEPESEPEPAADGPSA